ncbi:hypothetical protein [Streptomyces sp. NBC_00576]|uniref:hypothetical protein n=1 Tax=Streptomyces sp. NBC_00576 TaxID=2903665 RepID=UPI002E8233BA|nr:hypothetical protein [Streptomyces sp. NBC_00576]WUB70194.1 hypothetical protein OG734_08985 [Streptomyces sp. NBC_00576]
MTAGRGVRTVRAGVFAAVCVLLAALGHVLMSGSTVPWWTMAAGFAATSGLGWSLAARERGLPLVVSAVVLAQGALHSAFSLVQSAALGAAWSGSDSAAHRMSSMAMDAMDMGSMGSMDASGSMDMSAMGMSAMGMGHSAHADHLGHLAHDTGGTSSLGMLAAHTLAALLSGLWLAYGERAAFRVLRAVAGWLAAPLRLPLVVLPTPPHRPRPRQTGERAERVRRLTFAHSIVSRGPPAGIAVV